MQNNKPTTREVLDELGKIAAEVRPGAVPADTARQDNMDKIARLIDDTLGDCADELRAVGEDVAKSFNALAQIAVTHATDSRSMVESAGAEAKKVMAECAAAADYLRNTGTEMRARHDDFMAAVLSARAAALNARTSFTQHGVAKRDDQEVAVDMGRELLEKLDRVAPKAALVEGLRALLKPPAVYMKPEEVQASTAVIGDEQGEPGA